MILFTNLNLGPVQTYTSLVICQTSVYADNKLIRVYLSDYH